LVAHPLTDKPFSHSVSKNSHAKIAKNYSHPTLPVKFPGKQPELTNNVSPNQKIHDSKLISAIDQTDTTNKIFVKVSEVAGKVKDRKLKESLLECAADGMKLTEGMETDLFHERQSTQLSAKLVKAITPAARETEKWTTDVQDEQAEKAIEESERTGAGRAPACPRKAADSGSFAATAASATADPRNATEDGEEVGEEEDSEVVVGGEGITTRQHNYRYQQQNIPQHHPGRSASTDSSWPLVVSSPTPGNSSSLSTSFPSNSPIHTQVSGGVLPITASTAFTAYAEAGVVGSAPTASAAFTAYRQAGVVGSAFTAYAEAGVVGSASAAFTACGEAGVVGFESIAFATFTASRQAGVVGPECTASTQSAPTILVAHWRSNRAVLGTLDEDRGRGTAGQGLLARMESSTTPLPPSLTSNTTTISA
jgi:hypothetical protein